jgi:predicted house-cleaning noncanonical NTP pyrophosphatase (MazG superfamily)
MALMDDEPTQDDPQAELQRLREEAERLRLLADDRLETIKILTETIDRIVSLTTLASREVVEEEPPSRRWWRG